MDVIMKSTVISFFPQRRHILPLALVLAGSICFGQRLDPIQWSLKSEASRVPPGANVSLRLTATIEPGWHLYSLTTPKGGPIPTTASLAGSPTLESAALYQPQPERRFDPNFNLDTETFAEEMVLLVSGRLKQDVPAGMVDLTAEVRYQACNDRQCLPPRKKTASFQLAIDSSAPAPAPLVVPAGYTPLFPTGQSSSTQAPAAFGAQAKDGFGIFLLTAFGLGLAAVFTPCVFPMIPITVSFFLNRRGGIAQAATFSLGIVVLF